MFLSLVDFLSKLVLYLMIVGGAVYLFRSVWTGVWKTARVRWSGTTQRRRLRAATNYNPIIGMGTPGPRYSITVHLTDLLEATLPKTGPNVLRTFTLVSVGLGTVVYLFLFETFHQLLLPLFFAVIFMALPYFFLRIRKHRLAIRNSYDITPVIFLLVAKYRIERKNMAHAIRATLEELPRSPIQRALSRLLMRLNRHVTQDDALRAVRSFINQTGTVWAIQLSSLIYDGFIEGLDVEDSLVELSDDVTEVQGALQKQKLDRTDTLFVAFVPVVALPGGLYYFYDTLSHNLFYYQFGTAKGTFLFVLSAVVVLLSVSMAFVFYKPKQDI